MAGKVIYYIWTFIERFGTNIISLCGNILLSYLLLPEDFGLVATISVFTVMISIFVDCGMTSMCLLVALFAPYTALSAVGLPISSAILNLGYLCVCLVPVPLSAALALLR